MRLTARKAVELSIDLWASLAETGEDKDDWPEWESNGGQYPEARGLCFLCEYDFRKKGDCEACPYNIKYKSCCEEETPFVKWADAKNETDRKKFAKQFLGQLKKILKDMGEE